MTDKRTNRRDFLKGTAATTLAGLGAGYWVNGRRTWAAELDSKSANEKLGLASIGVGGKGESDCTQAARHGNLVAICDIDEQRLNKMGESHPKAKKYTDWRKMMDEMGKQIDAVTISTPDHTHAVATMRAIKEGKHVYTQKPLTHTVLEARKLREAAKQYKVSSQMGNQGSAENGLRRAVEIVQAGGIGDVKEVHVWTNRPVWPQSPKIKERPATEEVPAHVNWDAWLGPRKERPYSGKYYHPFNWRGWWDFGTGALGDMACHTANLPFRALKLGYPTSVSAESEEPNRETYPGWARVAFEFPARGDMPPVKFMWYEGKKDEKLVHPPEELVQKVLKQAKGKDGKRASMPGSGAIMVGEKGILYSPDDYGKVFELLPGENFADYKGPEETVPRRPKNKDDKDIDIDEWMKMEWLAGAKGGPKPYSNFDVAGMLTEFILLGNIAIKTRKKLEWDGPAMKFTNAPEADKLLHYEYRSGWTL
jgi:predicted dehydrogenase